LTQAVGTVLGRNPGLAADRSQVRQAEAARSEALFRSLPQLRWRSGYTRGNDPVYVFGMKMRQESFVQADFDPAKLNQPPLYTNFSNSFELGVPVFTAFELEGYRRLTGIARKRAEVRLEMDTQKTRFHAVDVYLRVLLAGEMVRSLDARITQAEAELGSANKLKAKGLVLGSDYEAARAIYEGLKLRRIQAVRQLAAAKSMLATMMGAREAQLELTGGLKEPSLREGSSSAPGRALGSRPEVADAGLQAEAAGVMRRTSDLSILPRVEAFGMIEANTGDFYTQPTYKMAGVRASWAFGDFSYIPKRRKARAMEETSAAYKAHVEEGVRLDTVRAAEGYRGAIESVPVATEMLARARESLERFQPLYREGRQSIMEVLRAEQSLAEAEQAYLETLYQAHAGYANLLLAMGELDEKGVREIEGSIREVRP